MIERYEPTDWQNQIIDTDGTVVQEGTPLSAENLNKIEGAVVELYGESHVHENKAVLDKIKPENVHEHANKTVLDNLTQRHLDDAHQHENKDVLDKITQSDLDSIANHELVLSDHEQRLIHITETITSLKIKVVPTIADRDQLEIKDNVIIHVVDASDDPTVSGGWAQYIYQNSEWVKIAENESIDITLAWADIVGKPTTFKPSEHGHSIEQITNLLETLNSKETPEGAQAKATVAQKSAIDWVKSMGLGQTLASRRTSDCDTAKMTGFYYVTGSATSRPPGITDGAMFVMTYDNDLWVTQLYIDWRTNRHYTRVCTNGTWSAWAELETPTGSQVKVDAHANLKDNPHNVTTTQVNYLGTYTRKMTDGADAYPLGVSVVFVGPSAQFGGWGFYGTVTTYKTYAAGGGTFQTYAPYGESGGSLGGGKYMVRYYEYPVYSWTAWQEFETTQGAQDKIDAHAIDAVKHLSPEERKALSDTISMVETHQTLLQELSKHTHDYNSLINKPVLPSKTSDLVNDSNFLQSNATRLHVSYNDSDIPELQINDIVIKVL